MGDGRRRALTTKKVVGLRREPRWPVKSLEPPSCGSSPTAFQSLQELREIARDRDFRRDMEALIKEAPQKLTQNKRSILSFYCRKSTGALEVRHSTAKSPTMEIAASRSANKISNVASQ